MERAGRVLARSKVAGKSVTPEELVRAAWPVAVGKRIAAHTSHLVAFEDRLLVEVEDAVWQQQLTTLTPHILQKLEQVLGRRIVSRLEFRVRALRRPPSRVALAEAPAVDEAERIADPVLRRVYLQSKKRATN